MEDSNITSPSKIQEQGDSDSVDIILADFASYLRKLKRNHAYASIHILADYFISIARCFTITISEYAYFLDKYQSSELTDADLSQTDIVTYLKSLIDRLEGVTGTIFNSSDLHLSSKKPLVAEYHPLTEVEEVQRLKQELADYPELSEILDETITSPETVRVETHETRDEVRQTFSRKLPQVSTRSSVGDPDLANILDQLPSSSATNKLEIHEETILRTVESLESFAFGEKVPLFKVLSEQPHVNQSPKN
jgi:hypothetical protein